MYIEDNHHIDHAIKTYMIVSYSGRRKPDMNDLVVENVVSLIDA